MSAVSSVRSCLRTQLEIHHVFYCTTYSGCFYQYKAVWKVKTQERRSQWWSIEAAAHQITTEPYRELSTGIDPIILIRYFFNITIVRAMVVDVQQPLAEFNVFSPRIVWHCPAPCAATIHKTSDQQWIGFPDSARIQDQRSICWLHTKHSLLS